MDAISRRVNFQVGGAAAQSVNRRELNRNNATASVLPIAGCELPCCAGVARSTDFSDTKPVVAAQGFVVGASAPLVAGFAAEAVTTCDWKQAPI